MHLKVSCSGEEGLRLNAGLKVSCSGEEGLRLNALEGFL